jgi:hypothetical protein
MEVIVGLYKYEWLHIPTGIRGTRTVSFISLSDFIEKINRWNQMGAGTWQYWTHVTIGKED